MPWAKLFDIEERRLKFFRAQPVNEDSRTTSPSWPCLQAAADGGADWRRATQHGIQLRCEAVECEHERRAATTVLFAP